MPHAIGSPAVGQGVSILVHYLQNELVVQCKYP